MTCCTCVSENSLLTVFGPLFTCENSEGYPDLSSDEPLPDSDVDEYLCTYSTIQGIKKLSLVNRIFVQKRQYCQKRKLLPHGTLKIGPILPLQFYHKKKIQQKKFYVSCAFYDTGGG